VPETQLLVKSCADCTDSVTIYPVSEQSTAPADLPLRPQDEVECRRCEVHCDKVVHPGACIESACPFVYAYEAWGRTTMGCMQKVFEVEIDLDLLLQAEKTRAGFGAVRALRTPLPMCRAEVSKCYEHRLDEVGCRNPEFHEVAASRPTFRVFAQPADR
jgi:hypothetical protein